MKQALREDVRECNADDSYELPPELRPVLQDDELPLGSPDEAIHDPPDESDDDAFDLKNTPDFDPDQDWESPFYKQENDAWIKADEQESLRGARLRLYEHSSIPRGAHEQKVVNSKDYQRETTPTSTLAPYVLVLQVPCKPGVTNIESEAQFAIMFQRYAYLVSLERYIRTTCYTQDDPALPRWLLVQEFVEMWEVTDFNLKKKEVEHWWRKNGWDGVIPEFFKSRETQ
ncbi:MAG: hypothetical protein Q9169_007394 [Polycauliona sp. 2 TL-2023]